MNSNNFTTTILVEQSREVVFQCVNRPKEWWSVSIQGSPEKLGEVWKYQFGDNHRSTIKTIELIPRKSVVWLIEENYFKGAEDQSEWVGNELRFDISVENGKTKLVFTQVGLVPAYNCFKSCDWAWTGFIQQSLATLIKTGKGELTWYENKLPHL